MKTKADSQDLIKSARASFASTFAYFLKAAGFHWNVVGPDFKEYHALFGDIYGEVEGSIDAYAEFIRTLDGTSPAGLQLMASLSKIGDSIEPLTATQMTQQLLDDGMTMLTVLEETYEKAEAEHDHGFSNFLAERLAAHKKHNWMLRSTLK